MMDGSHVCVLRASAEDAAAWEERSVELGAEIVDASRLAAAPALLHRTVCVLVDGAREAAVDRVRRVRRADSAVQGVIVAAGPDRPRIEHEVLFAPGLGEVWIVAPEEVGPDLFGRATDVARKRRRHQLNRRQLEHALTAIEPSEARRAVISDAYLASLLEAVPDPIISVDASGCVLSWNPGAEQVLGYGRAEALGKRVSELLGAELQIDEALHETRRDEIRFRRKNGEAGIGECIVVPVDAAGRRVWAVMIHDLTEERRTQDLLESQAAELEAQAAEMEMQAVQLEEHTLQLERVNADLRQRTEELERAASTRSRFYASMSHELRTPINAIIGYNALVLDGIYGAVPEAQQKALERAQRAASHLLDLVNDVLDLAKIEAGRITLQVERVCAPALLTELLDTVRSLADQHGCEITIEGPGVDPETHCIRTDPRRVRQILLNLLSNAVKFGRGEAVTLGWRATEEGGLQFDVVDRGVGIAPEHLERIFEEFTQLETDSAGGTGLGLPISRRLAAVLGGSLTATSVVGEGSVFSLRLPPDVAPTQNDSGS
jgi:PAS domain S-box-containing protein